MEGVIQYRLLGKHPAASGRYLTLGFPGESTTADKIIEQVVQEHRINTSINKLEVRRLIAARDAPGSATASPPPPPSGGEGGASDGGVGWPGGPRDAVVSVVIHGSDELHTYDRLTITVSTRDLADDEASREEQEQLERQRRIEEMEEQLLATTSSSVLTDAVGFSNSASASPPPFSAAATRTAAVAGVAMAAADSLRLQRAAVLASQLFPILKGQCSSLMSLSDPANTHQCVLCRLPAFEERLTPCCHYPACASCYASAAEMDMEDGQCPVCGTKHTPETHTNVSNTGGGSRSYQSGVACDGNDGRGGGESLKRSRDSGDVDARYAWKREEATDSKEPLRHTMRVAADDADTRDGDRQRSGSGGRARIAPPSSAHDRGDRERALLSPSSVSCPRGAAAAASSSPVSGVVPKEVLQIEERLRRDLEKLLAVLDGPDPLSAASKAKRVVSAELAALGE